MFSTRQSTQPFHNYSTIITTTHDNFRHRLAQLLATTTSRHTALAWILRRAWPTKSPTTASPVCFTAISNSIRIWECTTYKQDITTQPTTNSTKRTRLKTSTKTHNPSTNTPIAIETQ